MENVRGKRRTRFCFAVMLLVPEVGLEPTLPGGNRILSPLHPQTQGDTEGQKYAFVGDQALPKGQGRTRRDTQLRSELRSKSVLGNATFLGA